MPTRILVVDDDKRIAASLRRALSYEGYDVSVAYDGWEALDAAHEAGPDLVVLDVMLPGINGIDVCRRLRSSNEGVLILMLTARTSVPDRVEGLDAGADDYLVKPFALREMEMRVEALVRRAQPRAAPVLRLGELSLDPGTLIARRGERELDVNRTGRALLRLLLETHPDVLTRERIEEVLWEGFPPGSEVLRTHVYALRKALRAGGEEDPVETVRGVGYKLRAEVLGDG